MGSPPSRESYPPDDALSSQQRQRLLWQRIGLCQNRDAGLGEDLVLREHRCLLGNVRISNPRFGRGEVFGRDRQILDRDLEPALDRAVIRAGGCDCDDRAVDLRQHRLRGRRRRHACAGQSDRRHVEVIQGHVQRIARSTLEADKDLKRVAASAQKRLTVIFRGRGNPVDFRTQCHKFLVQVGTLGRSQRSAGRLSRQLTHTRQQAADRRRRTVGDLRQADAVTGVSIGLIDTANLRPQGFGHAQTGRVIGRTGDPQTR